MRIRFITQHAVETRTGGVTAVNHHIYEALRKQINVLYDGPIAPASDPLGEFLSRMVRRILHRPGRFARYSEKALTATAQSVSRHSADPPDGWFFRGSTPWVATRPDHPYWAYLDMCFHTYVANTFAPRAFHAADLQRVYDAEAAWMRRADTLFFESQWGCDRCCAAYGIAHEKCVVAGRGTAVSAPSADRYDPAARPRTVLTIANRFHQKGGDLAAECVAHMRRTMPDLVWHIVGGPPPARVAASDGVIYEGQLRREVTAEADRFDALLATSTFLLHPSREDGNPLVLTEAALFGCPSLSVRRFAIPELVRDGETGLLFDVPVAPEHMAEAALVLLADTDRYLAMRAAARAHALESSDWNSIADRILRRIARRGL